MPIEVIVDVGARFNSSFNLAAQRCLPWLIPLTAKHGIPESIKDSSQTLIIRLHEVRHSLSKQAMLCTSPALHISADDILSLIYVNRYAENMNERAKSGPCTN